MSLTHCLSWYSMDTTVYYTVYSLYIGWPPQIQGKLRQVTSEPFLQQMLIFSEHYLRTAFGPKNSC